MGICGYYSMRAYTQTDPCILKMSFYLWERCCAIAIIGNGRNIHTELLSEYTQTW